MSRRQRRTRVKVHVKMLLRHPSGFGGDGTACSVRWMTEVAYAIHDICIARPAEAVAQALASHLV
jgi:hypothetical protein